MSMGEEVNLFQVGTADMHTESGTLQGVNAWLMAANWTYVDVKLG